MPPGHGTRDGAIAAQRVGNPEAPDEHLPILVVMGVSGVGKTTVGRELAERLGWPFEEGDSLHPAANVAKMHAGVPLNDADRKPWLEAIAAWIDGQRAAGHPGIITCSALKRAYRRTIIGDRRDVRLIYLKGDRDLIADRLARRRDHFMPASLLQSQLDTLEPPGADEDPITLAAGLPVSELAERVILSLGLPASGTEAPSRTRSE